MSATNICGGITIRGHLTNSGLMEARHIVIRARRRAATVVATRGGWIVTGARGAELGTLLAEHVYAPYGVQ